MWKSIHINETSIIRITDKSSLIRMPNSSNYAGYQFWHPNKLIREQLRKPYILNLSYTDEFEFRIFKNGQGKYNKYKKIDEKVIGTEELEEAFEKMDKNINPRGNEHYLIVEEPDKISFDFDVEVDEELLNVDR